MPAGRRIAAGGAQSTIKSTASSGRKPGPASAARPSGAAAATVPPAVVGLAGLSTLTLLAHHLLLPAYATTDPGIGVPSRLTKDDVFTLPAALPSPLGSLQLPYHPLALLSAGWLVLGCSFALHGFVAHAVLIGDGTVRSPRGVAAVWLRAALAILPLRLLAFVTWTLHANGPRDLLSKEFASDAVNAVTALHVWSRDPVVFFGARGPWAVIWESGVLLNLCVALPLLAPFVRAVGPVLSSVLAAAISMAWRDHQLRQGLPAMQPFSLGVGVDGPIGHLDEFVLGMALSALHVRWTHDAGSEPGRARPVRAWLVGAMLVATGLLALHGASSTWEYTQRRYMIPPVGMLVARGMSLLGHACLLLAALVAAHGGGGRRTQPAMLTLGNPVMRAIGRISAPLRAMLPLVSLLALPPAPPGGDAVPRPARVATALALLFLAAALARPLATGAPALWKRALLLSADQDAGRKRLPAVEGLKGLIAVSVMWHHVFGTFFTPPAWTRFAMCRLIPGSDRCDLRESALLARQQPHLPADLSAWARSPLSNGWLGVTLSFVLSGLLTHASAAHLRSTVRDRRGVGSFVAAAFAFYHRRFARLVPLFYFTLAVSVFCKPNHPPHDLGSADFAKETLSMATFAFAWSEDPTVWFPVRYNWVAWSLGVEVGFILVYPWLLLAYERRRKLIAVAVALACAAFRFDAVSSGAAMAGDVLNVKRDSIRGRLDDFVAGMLIADLLQLGAAAGTSRPRPLTGLGRPALLCLAIPASLLTLGAACLTWDRVRLGVTPLMATPWLQCMTTAGFALILLPLLSAESDPNPPIPLRWMHRIVASWPLRWIGRRAYGVYLWHGLPISVVLAPLGFGVLRFVAYCVLVLILATLTLPLEASEGSGRSATSSETSLSKEKRQ